MNQVLHRSSAAGDGNRLIEINTYGHSASSTTIVSSSADVPAPAPVSPRALENAVYGYIRAVRALGRTQISASEIATALSVPISEVITALNGLRSKGVKAAE